MGVKSKYIFSRDLRQSLTLLIFNNYWNELKFSVTSVTFKKQSNFEKSLRKMLISKSITSKTGHFLNGFRPFVVIHLRDDLISEVIFRGKSTGKKLDDFHKYVLSFFIFLDVFSKVFRFERLFLISWNWLFWSIYKISRHTRSLNEKIAAYTTDKPKLSYFIE